MSSAPDDLFGRGGTVAKLLALRYRAPVTSTQTLSRAVSVGRHSVDRFRDLVAAGGFSRAAAVDRHSGEVIDAQARALFAALPAVTPATTPDEIVAHALVGKLPGGLYRAFTEPKYRPGRELFVRATVSQKDGLASPAGRFDPAGEETFTHCARLRAQGRDHLVVELEGKPSAMVFAKAEVFAWNEPVGVPPQGGVISGVNVDYNDPLMKAHICAGFFAIADDLAQMDFGAAQSDSSVFQERLVHRLASRVKMHFPGRGDGYAGSRAGSLLAGGVGVSFVQRAVAGAYLQAFARVLAFEVQLAVGKTLKEQVPHGFAVVTLRPSLKRFVCDPAWGEPLTALPVAFFDSRWGHNRALSGFEGVQEITVRPEEVALPEEEEA